MTRLRWDDGVVDATIVHNDAAAAETAPPVLRRFSAADTKTTARDRWRRGLPLLEQALLLN